MSVDQNQLPTNLVVGFDMGGTAAVLRGETMRQHTLRVYRTHGMVPSSVSDADILKTIADIRRIFEGAGEAHRDKDAFWFAVNSVVLDRLITNPDHRKFLAVYARRIHGAFLEKEAYQACPVVVEVVRKLRARGARVIITSNSTHTEAEEILRHIGILNEFDAVLTSDSLNARKTEEKFWKSALEHAFPEGVPQELTAIQVGNSLYSDGFAARFGWHTLIIDEHRRYRPHTVRVHLSDQFTFEHKNRVKNDIGSKRIRFVRTRNGLRTLFKTRGYI